jgi:hypothetical protein
MLRIISKRVISAQPTLKSASIAKPLFAVNTARSLAQQAQAKLATILSEEAKFEKDEGVYQEKMPSEIASMLKELKFEVYLGS